MIEAILTGILANLHALFPDAELLTEYTEQGWRPNSIVVTCIDSDSRRYMDTKHQQHALISVQYFPHEKADAKRLCNEALDAMKIGLEVIPTGFRASRINGTIVDDYLSVAIAYTYFVREQREREPMETIDIKEGTE